MIKGHGDDFYKYTYPIGINFSSNSCPHTDLAPLKAHLCGCMEVIESYPEPEPYTLQAHIAARFGLSADSVAVTNGATEAIYLIAEAFRGGNSVILQPTFSEYADACRLHGHRVTAIYRLSALSENHCSDAAVNLCWICNPNNPTGSVTEKGVLSKLIVSNPQVCFVIDQSYEDFTLSPLLSGIEAAAYPNVLLLHSLTKRYAIPGLRVGYVTGNSALLNRLRAHRMPWSVNQLAIQAGLYLLEHDLPCSTTLADYLQEAARLRASLQALGYLDVWESDTHFMLGCLHHGKASALKEYLVREHGMLIRDASNFEGLDDRFFRIATQKVEENNRLVEAIAAFFRLKQ